MNATFKNVPNDVVTLESLVNIVDKQIISSNLFDAENINISVFSFADFENISEEQYSGETLFYVISGSCRIKIKEEYVNLKQGDIYKVDKSTLHAVHANEAFRMLQITLK